MRSTAVDGMAHPPRVNAVRAAGFARDMAIDVVRCFIRRLRAQCLHIAGLSATLGRARPELQPGVRSFPFEGYLVVMRYTGDVLEIVNVIEGHRDIKALFRKSES